MTNLIEILETRKLIVERMMQGIEPFYINGEKWVDAFGRKTKFEDADDSVKLEIIRCYENDLQSAKYMKGVLKINGEDESFETWYRCVVGGLDNEPDIINGKFYPDKFNNLCIKDVCDHRGKFCGTRSGLRDYEVQTLIALKTGNSSQKTAEMIHVSHAGIKSRIENLKVKLGAGNMAALISIVSDFGV